MIRVLIAEDMNLLRDALVSLLSFEEDIEVVAELERGDAIVPTAMSTQPDVAVIDIGLPGMDGLTAAAQLHEMLPDCRVLILTSYGRPGELRKSLEVRAAGFVVKDAPAAYLADAIRRVARGERVIDTELAATAIEVGDNPLTPRERAVLVCIAQGASVEDAAAQVHLSPGTVRNYLSTIIAKVGARNRVDAIRIARDYGWI
ncbi:MAG TPA: response regulator transcription factor [Streptosporangiaceae bacterium]